MIEQHKASAYPVFKAKPWQRVTLIRGVVYTKAARSLHDAVASRRGAGKQLETTAFGLELR